MKLSAWAKKNGLTYKAAWRLFKTGQLPVGATQLKTGTILVHELPDSLPDRAALYARVSSHDQKADSLRQMERLRNFAAAKGLPVAKEIIEIGSGLNGRRKNRKLLADPTITVIVVEHQDRLARLCLCLVLGQFGFESHYHHVLVQRTRHLDQAYANFFRRVAQRAMRSTTPSTKRDGQLNGKVGFPKFKSKKCGLGSFRLTLCALCSSTLLLIEY